MSAETFQFPVAAADATAAELCRRFAVNRVVTVPAGLQDKGELLDSLAVLCQFPEWQGRNFDALYDQWIGRLDDADHSLLVHHEDLPLDGEEHRAYLRVLADVCEEAGSAPGTFLASFPVATEVASKGGSAGFASEAGNQRRLLLISNSTQHGGGYLEHCAKEIADFLGSERTVFFVPYALAKHDDYARAARGAFESMGHTVRSAHEGTSPLDQLAECDAVFIGGGNTFRLLKTLYETGLLEAIRAKCRAGVPYIGTSAGSNVACRSIRTTNDMPIVQPPSFDALQLVMFNLNPHYLDPDPTSTHMGETRETRIMEFHEENDVPVLGLREGGLLRIEGNTMTLLGDRPLRLFRCGEVPEEVESGSDLSALLI